MMTEGAALAKKEAAAAATAATTTTFKPIVGVLASATTDTEAGARPEDVTINTRRPSISAAERGKAAKHKVARNMSDVTCRFAFPVLYALFVVVMLGSLEAYGHASECDWD